MRFSTAAAGALALAGSALAAPVAGGHKYGGGSANLDVVVLQFALTLEHLENVFYHEALQKFTVDDFTAAGYDPSVYSNLEYISFDEQTHVQTLSATLRSLGEKPVKAGQYSFPYTDVPSFIALSQVLENVGVSAYTGAAPLITDPFYLTVAATILDVEAIHTSYQRANLDLVPMANPFETPLSPTAVFTLASAFIVSLPPKNFALPFTPFAGLTADTPTAALGDTVSFTADGKVPAGSYLTFVAGIAVTSVAGDISGKSISAAVPDEAVGGQVYVFVTDSDISGTAADYTDDAVLFGPAIVEVTPAAPAIDFSIR